MKRATSSDGMLQQRRAEEARDAEETRRIGRRPEPAVFVRRPREEHRPQHLADIGAGEQQARLLRRRCHSDHQHRHHERDRERVEPVEERRDADDEPRLDVRARDRQPLEPRGDVALRRGERDAIGAAEAPAGLPAVATNCDMTFPPPGEPIRAGAERDNAMRGMQGTRKLSWQAAPRVSQMSGVTPGGFDLIGLVRLALRRPYTAAIAALLIFLMGGLALTRMIVDIFPIIDIPVVLVVWNYPRPLGRGHGAPRRAGQRARLFDDASTASSASNRSRSPASASSRSTSSRAPTSAPPSRRSPRSTITDPAHRAARHHAAQRHPVQRLERAGRAAHASRARPLHRAGDLRLRAELHAAQALHHPRPRRSRRPSAASSARSSSTSTRAARREGLLAERRGQRAAGVERHRPRRHRPHRRPRIQRRAQFEPADGRPVQPACRSASATACR